MVVVLLTYPHLKKTVESVYDAVSKKDADLYSKWFYKGGEFKIAGIKYAARYIFTHVKIIK